jgi:stage V sporulation protein B
MLEQIVRVGFVYIIALMFGEGKLDITCELAVYGIVIGEIASNIYNILSLKFQKTNPKSMVKEHISFAKPLAKISLPLSMNRLLISILHSVEAVMIPTMLRRSGLTTAQALSLFGILNGMTLPFLLFPSTITNSLSVLLLPAISEAKAKDNNKLITHTVSVSLKYSLILGIFSAGFFIYFGDPLGMAVFHVREAGSYLTILAWLCPFLYAATTLSSVINGLGKAHLTFVNSIIGLSFRIILLAFFVPSYGIMGSLISLLVSQLLITGLDFFIVYKYLPFPLDSINSIVKPAIVAWFSCSFMYRAYEFIITITSINRTIIILLCCGILALANVAILKTFHAIVRGEWHPKL